MARIYLGFVGVAYVLLALWCAFAPAQTSQAVGFQLIPGQGQSEYLTVYGGLQLALGAIFLWPLYRPQVTIGCLQVCVAIFAALVVFRTIGFLVFSDFSSFTYGLAAGEWLMLLIGLAILWRSRSWLKA